MATKTKKEQVKIMVNGEAKIIDLDNLTLFKTLFEEEIIARLIDMFVPVGSWMELYTDEIDPADIIPNTDWLPEADGTVLRAAGNNSIVGSDSHTLTETEMPYHQHSMVMDGDSGATGRCVAWNDNAFYCANSGGARPTSSSDWILMQGAAGTYQYEVGGGYIGAKGNSQSHSILQKSQNCYRYRRVARAA